MTPQADWVKAIESLRTSPTGAINMVFYNNGKKVGRVGVNKIEDLKEDLINLFKYEITLAQQRTEKKWRERVEKLRKPEIKRRLHALMLADRNEGYNQCIEDIKKLGIEVRMATPAEYSDLLK